MSVTAIVGLQYGDEGKGGITDYLAQEADLVIRYQGGANAGHTIVNFAGTFVLHQVPAGIFNPACTCLLGTGMAVDPEQLLAELAMLEQAGVSTERVLISERAHTVLPYHKAADRAEEAVRAGEAIGTTLQGVGPAYADKVRRIGIQIGDAIDPERLQERLAALQALAIERPLDVDDQQRQATRWASSLGSRLVDPLPIVREAWRGGRRLLLEGQLGVLRDLDWGIYPFVTASNPVAGYAAGGSGLPPAAVDDVLGVLHPYTTAVGAGPFPTELTDGTGERLRLVGREFGATTGRPRRLGWFDAVATRYAAELSGATRLCLTKLDVLSGLSSISLGTRYRLPDGSTTDRFPPPRLAGRVTPEYEAWPGWTEEIGNCRRFADLPAAAQRLVRRIEELVGVPVAYVSVGPAREALVVMPGAA